MKDASLAHAHGIVFGEGKRKLDNRCERFVIVQGQGGFDYA